MTPSTFHSLTWQGICKEMNHTGVQRTLELATDLFGWPQAAWTVERKCQTNENCFRRKAKSEMAAKSFPQESVKVELLDGVHAGVIIPQVMASIQKGKIFSWFNFTTLDRGLWDSNNRLQNWSGGEGEALKNINRKIFWNYTCMTLPVNSLVPTTKSKTAITGIMWWISGKRDCLR